jgi:hypothetical protein
MKRQKILTTFTALALVLSSLVPGLTLAASTVQVAAAQGMTETPATCTANLLVETGGLAPATVDQARACTATGGVQAASGQAIIPLTGLASPSDPCIAGLLVETGGLAPASVADARVCSSTSGL